MKDDSQTELEAECGAPQAENKDASGLLENDNTLSSRTASVCSAGDGELQRRTSLRE